MFTHAENLNVLDKNQIVMIHLKDSIVDNFMDIFQISLGEKKQRFSISLGGLCKAISLWIFSNMLQKFLRHFCHFLLVLGVVSLDIVFFTFAKRFGLYEDWYRLIGNWGLI